MKICPRCGSRNIDWIIPQNWSLQVCKSCNYTGPAIDGNDELANQIMEKYIEETGYEKDNNTKEDEKVEEDFEEDFEYELSDEELEKILDNLHKK